MKFKSALIVNFKLLREVSLEFSLDPSRPVTVIRAENGSGKTSTLSALQWGLFGDAGLDPSAREVRLSPSDWPDGKRCDIRVQIDFTHTVYDELGGELVAKHTNYRIVRTVSETPKGEKQFSREREQMHLFELTDSGNEMLKGAEVRLAEMLPIEMKDVAKIREARKSLESSHDQIAYVAIEGDISKSRFRAVKARFSFPNQLTWSDRTSILHQVRSFRRHRFR